MKKSLAITLVEMLIVISILTIVSGILVAIFISGWRLFHQQSASTETQAQAKLATSVITKSIQQANKVPTSKTLDSISYTSSTNTLVLELPSLDTNQNIIEGAFDYEVFYKDPAAHTKLKLKRETSPASSRKSETKTIANLIENIEFTYNSPDNKIENTNRITVSVSAAQISYGKTQKTSLTGQAKLRNK